VTVSSIADFPIAASPVAVSPPLQNDPCYIAAAEKASGGEFLKARQLFEDLLSLVHDKSDRAVVENNLGALAVGIGDPDAGRRRFRAALGLDPGCTTAQENLAFLDRLALEPQADNTGVAPIASSSAAQKRLAIVSLLFNWPSTGGGTVHTAELGKFLGRAGYFVRHFYAQYAGWGVGNVTTETGVPSTPLSFDDTSWNIAEIQRRFRQAVDEFGPDFVIITDSWNSKPLLAEAMKGYRYFLRLAAQECLCPLNNVRLLIDDRGGGIACPRHQLASPHLCHDCVLRRQRFSGGLHRPSGHCRDMAVPNTTRNCVRHSLTPPACSS
jgi:hypothetical protein